MQQTVLYLMSLCRNAQTVLHHLTSSCISLFNLFSLVRKSILGKEGMKKEHGDERGRSLKSEAANHARSLHLLHKFEMTRKPVPSMQWKTEQANRCCTADVCLHQSVNQLYNNQEMAKLVLFSTACRERSHSQPGKRTRNEARRLDAI